MTAAQISLVCSDRYTTLAIWAPRSHMGNPWIILLLPLWYWTTYHSLFPWPEHIRRDGSLPNCLLTTLEGILQLVCLSSFGIAHMEFQDPFLSHTIMQPTTHVPTMSQPLWLQHRYRWYAATGIPPLPSELHVATWAILGSYCYSPYGTGLPITLCFLGLNTYVEMEVYLIAY